MEANDGSAETDIERERMRSFGGFHEDVECLMAPAAKSAVKIVAVD